MASKIDIKRRKCLRCQKMFLSEGISNRICQTCQSTINKTASSKESVKVTVAGHKSLSND